MLEGTNHLDLLYGQLADEIATPLLRKKDVYITDWDSITKATLKGKNTFSGINQAFGDSSNRDSKTAFATAIRLDSSTCCNQEPDSDETDIDCGGPCAPCFTGMICVDNADCLSGSCDDGICD